MRKSFLCGLTLLFPLVAFGHPSLTVVDQDGNPVERFAVMVHTADHGYENWRIGSNGSFGLWSLRTYSEAAAIDVVVRAEGYASVFRSFRGAAKNEFVENGAKVVLERGREVRLRLQPPAEMALPDGFLPQVYFPELAWRVQIMWQPENLRFGWPDFNMLNVRPAPEDTGEFVFRLPREPREFLVAVFQPGWLRFFKAGPFASENFTNDAMTLEIPRPATIAASFNWGDRDRADLPFTGVRYHVMRQLRAGGNSYLSVASDERALDDTSLHITDLAPGNYLLQVYTVPKEADELVAGTEINPGRFSARRYLEVQAGKSASASLTYVPFDPEANRGERTAQVRVISADGSPAAGRQLKVSWFDGHYGALTIFDGAIPTDGLVVLEGISDEVPAEVPFGPYAVKVDGVSLGFFRVKARAEPQEFVFRMVPVVGDTAPDVELVALETGEHLRLKDLRGRLVFLEFWETGCGPCQPMMAELNELVGLHKNEWNDEVVVVPISLDADPEIIASHVRSRGWTNLHHYWSIRSDGEYFADAARAFVVHAVPTALFIDRDGTINWRGHPASFELEEEIAKLGAE